MTTPDDPGVAQPGPAQPGPGVATGPFHPAYPQYPVHQYAYPLPPRRRWPWVVAGVAAVVVVGIIALVIGGLSSWGDPGYYDSEYVVEQTRVLHATEKPCEAMVHAGLEIDTFAGSAAGAKSLTAFVPPLRAVATAVDGARPNADARQWSRDLTTLANSLDAYATALAADPSARYAMPRPARASITGRMDGGSPVGCEIPIAIDALDPAAAADFYN